MVSGSWYFMLNLQGTLTQAFSPKHTHLRKVQTKMYCVLHLRFCQRQDYNSRRPRIWGQGGEGSILYFPSPRYVPLLCYMFLSYQLLHKPDEVGRIFFFFFFCKKWGNCSASKKWQNQDLNSSLTLKSIFCPLTWCFLPRTNSCLGLGACFSTASGVFIFQFCQFGNSKSVICSN